MAVRTDRIGVLSRWRAQRGPRSALVGVTAGAAAVAAVTGVVFAVRSFVPVLSLGALYVFAVLPIAVAFGRVYAVGVAVSCMLAFNWFFLPPVHTFTLAESENWFALAVYVATALVVGELAARARRRAAEAEHRAAETAFLANVATSLLRTGELRDDLNRAGAEIARLLAVDEARIVLGAGTTPHAGQTALPLSIAGRRVGTLLLPPDVADPASIGARLAPALASLLAVAVDRERLAAEALEAEALRRSDAMKTSILQSVSHDLRSPLTAIAAAASGLASDDVTLDEADRMVMAKTIEAETRRLDRLVGNLLDLSRLQAGAASPHPELWVADELVASALEELGDQAERVEVALPERLPTVWVDAVQIQRVLVNVIDNALKFSPPASRVDVVIGGDETEVVVSVIDRGPGFADEDAERIFLPFQRSTSDARGAGLGLAIAHGFAAANGGRLSARADSGHGSVFTLALPAARNAAPASR